ncbi:hypothetical protein BC826DRAFT_1047950, partial [Russula brevipes]
MPTEAYIRRALLSHPVLSPSPHIPSSNFSSGRGSGQLSVSHCSCAHATWRASVLGRC